MDGEVSSRLRQRPRPLSYRYDDSDSDRPLPTRKSLRLRNYSESDDGSETDLVASSRDNLANTPPPSPPRRSKFSTDKLHKKRPSRAPMNVVFQGFKRRKTFTDDITIKKVKPQSGITSPVPSKSGRILPWQNLEYQILLKIMRYAAYPFYEGASRDTGSIRWLLDTSMLCSSFHDACIGAMMVSPPLYPASRAHWLLNLLKASARDYSEGPGQERGSGKLSLDYRKKVKCLNVEVKQVLLKKQGIDLEQLLSHTPLLKQLHLYHNHDALDKDFVWAQPQHAKGKKWAYADLFSILDRYKIELESFDWNGRFLKQDPDLSSMIQAHSQKCLQRLTSISLFHLNVYNEKDVSRMASCRANMLKALSKLSELKYLAIRNCDILDSATVAALPFGLQSLTIDTCIHVTSDAMHDYLRAKGSSLINLKLLHNQSMSLDFTTSLDASTPKLQHVELDLTYHDITSFRDTEPLFDSLLPSGPPTWPSSLVTITVGPLRGLSTTDAEAFYDSIISAAPQFSYLRELRLKTLLNKSSWRDRADLRAKWNARMNQVFDLSYDPEKLADSKRKSGRIHEVVDLPRQGRCHTVEFELSDQRPAQEQYKEADFLDSEPSDDAEWNGSDDALEPVYSARRCAW